MTILTIIRMVSMMVINVPNNKFKITVEESWIKYDI